MERASDKHGPRLDDALEQDTRSIVQGQPVEARADEAREQEGPGEGEPTPDVRLTGDEVEARAELARHLDPSVFPARTEQLCESAARHHAPGWILTLLRALPDGTYDTTEDVWSALGGTRETRSA
ncbi:MAG: DUF2795 domain-containing protein [Acidimicrobiales bacterium]